LRKLRITSIVITLIAAVFLSISLVAALEPGEASATVYWSKGSPSPGDIVTVTVNFQSNTENQLQLSAIGIHADWMEADRFYGPTFSNPATVTGMGSYISESFTILIPADATIGSHSYYVGIEGAEATGAPFSWDSAQSTISISAASSPTPTTSPKGGPLETPHDWLIYLAAIVAVVIILVVLLLFVRKKRGHRAPEAEPLDNQPKPPAPEENTASEQDFNI
jgi:hypothetical protein